MRQNIPVFGDFVYFMCVFPVQNFFSALVTGDIGAGERGDIKGERNTLSCSLACR